MVGNVRWVRYSIREIASKGRRECMGLMSYRRFGRGQSLRSDRAPARARSLLSARSLWSKKYASEEKLRMRENEMFPSPWTRPIRTFQTTELRFILPIRSDRLTGPCIGSTRERPDWSFVQILDQMLELTELKPESPGQLDKPGLMVKPKPTKLEPTPFQTMASLF
ncbi:hypothetical protein F2Q70_00025936 [Brassica cretica]|uniref:Uncharacterized protein n=1 Tax=Brassica cretica TaxID=69181 RepID=A0A8S9L494_BRACR|nr:hypothetical protein F2Q70_00025936 [Brassica cretica]